MNNNNNSNVYRNKYKNKKYKAKLRIAFISSCLVPLEEFGPTNLPF